MGVDEAGKNRFPGQINRLSGFGCECLDLLLLPDGKDLSSAKGKTVGFGDGWEYGSPQNGIDVHLLKDSSYNRRWEQTVPFSWVEWLGGRLQCLGGDGDAAV